MVKIAIVNSSSFARLIPEHARRLRRLGPARRFMVPIDIDGAELGRLLRGYPYVVASVNPTFDAAFFDACGPGLRLLARHGIGTNNVDLRAAHEHGVLVTKVAGVVEREAMAEHSVALLLACLRRLSPAQAKVRARGWHERSAFVGTESRGRKVGIFGLGNIGSRVAQILARGFGAEILACDPKVRAAQASAGEIYRHADIISLHCSLSPQNRHMLGREAFARMRRGVVLVNTARGELVALQPLLAALKSGQVAAYGADVVEGEPVTDRKHPLLRQPNALIVPHIGAYTRESLEGMGAKMLDDIEAVLKGRRPQELARP